MLVLEQRMDAKRVRPSYSKANAGQERRRRKSSIMASKKNRRRRLIKNAFLVMDRVWVGNLLP
jgi:hypothetical protein